MSFTPSEVHDETDMIMLMRTEMAFMIYVLLVGKIETFTVRTVVLECMSSLSVHFFNKVSQ